MRDILLFILAFWLLTYLAKQASQNRDDAKLKELQQIVSQTPVFPGFTDVNTHYSSRFSDAGIYKYYHSTAAFDDVKSFYQMSLSQNGWLRTQEESRDGWKKFTLSKGEFRIAIEFSDNKNQSWNYAINFLWH